MGMLDRTYKQKRGPKPTSFVAYSKRIKREYKELLARDPDERTVQQFLESSPSLVPGARTPGAISGHWPMHLALISQPTLKGFGGSVPDFLWLSQHSGAWYPAMIEIESPKKPLFTKAGVPSAAFNQARNQLVQWHSWLDSPANQLSFIEDYGAEPHFRQMGRHFILIYGRRSEFESKPQLKKHRGKLLTGEMELMSFDRLTPDPDLSNAITVKPIGNGRFRVLYVPETFGVCPQVANYLNSYVGLEKAIERNSRISCERRNFLKERISYWIEWAKSDAPSITGGDFLE
jgi:hypothetical protein